MQYIIKNEVPGRIRVQLDGVVRADDVDPLIKVLDECPAIIEAKVYPRIGSVAVRFGTYDLERTRKRVLDYLDTLDQQMLEDARSDYNFSLAPRAQNLLLDIATLVGGRIFRRVFFPWPLRAVWNAWHYLSYLRKAGASLAAGRLDVPVLDASAIGVSFLQGDPDTAGSTMFLLDLEDKLEEYTRSNSTNELIYSLLASPDLANRITKDGQEEQVPATELEVGDLIAVRTGQPVPIDGNVERGTAMVNQAALTGEPLPVERTAGDSVFAGTAVDNGEIYVRVAKTAGKTKLRSIVSLVEQSGELRSESEERRDKLANSIVPWNFLLALIVAITTRSVTKTAATLMVDYSCALKLTGSISVLSAMSESAKLGFTVKGSKHFEQIAAADTIVFDKTGTLTEATPHVFSVMGFNGHRRDQVLRLAACLEEHYPHPVARAVVNAAAEHNLKHRERHAEVEYIVAHGLASSLDGKRVVIGSRHFVTEDEHIPVTHEQHERINEELHGLSALYLAVDGQLVGVIGIEDPLKPGTRDAVDDLRALGFKHIVMLTGDNYEAARRAAEEAGITEFQANCLPEDKHQYVLNARARGQKVVMVGDGINDSPALRAADVGVAMAAGTAIAREVADVTLTDSDLTALVTLRKLSMGLMRRLDSSFWQIMVWNSTLLALGIGGVITPQTSALLHNASTVLFGLNASRAYLPKEDGKAQEAAEEAQLEAAKAQAALPAPATA